MGRNFFTGGMMPSAELLSGFSRDLMVTHQYQWNGRHYERTAEAWLANLDQNRGKVLQILKSVYGVAESRRWLNRWRMFFLAVAELFGFASGEEWFVSHYLMERVEQSEFKVIPKN
jgi:cyclopropane-fatty-acyl-phospholipid synthase